MVHTINHSNAISFTVTIEQPNLSGSTLEFHLSGSNEYGLDKSIVNSLRRVLLSEIPCVAFRISRRCRKRYNYQS